jgi:hypothetical protein
MKQKHTLQYVAIGQLKGKQPEAINSFDDIKDASMCAAEFVANNGGSGWVETVAAKEVTHER